MKAIRYFVRLIVGFVFGGFACVTIVLFVVDAYADLRFDKVAYHILGEGNRLGSVFLIGGSILSIVFGLFGAIRIHQKWTIYLVAVLAFLAISIVAASILAVPISGERNSNMPVE